MFALRGFKDTWIITMSAWLHCQHILFYTLPNCYRQIQLLVNSITASSIVTVEWHLNVQKCRNTRIHIQDPSAQPFATIKNSSDSIRGRLGMAEYFGDDQRQKSDHGQTPNPSLSLRCEGAEASGAGGLSVQDGHQAGIGEELHHVHEEHQSCLARHVQLIEHCEPGGLLGEERPHQPQHDLHKQFEWHFSFRHDWVQS